MYFEKQISLGISPTRPQGRWQLEILLQLSLNQRLLLINIRYALIPCYRLR